MTSLSQVANMLDLDVVVQVFIHLSFLLTTAFYVLFIFPSNLISLPFLTMKPTISLSYYLQKKKRKLGIILNRV